MKKSKADIWVAALLSGEYEQGSGALLSSDGKYCCLGVGCKVMGVEPRLWHQNGDTYIKFGGDSAVLTDDTKELLTVNSSCVNVVLTRKERQYLDDKYLEVFDADTDLTTLNDKGVSFKDIAKIIKKHYKEL
jgi:hypothetical protein